MNKTTRTLLLLFSTVLLLSACAKEASEKSDENASIKTVEMKTITDHAENTVEVPVEPKRIASLSDFQTLKILELGNSVVGTHTRKTKEGEVYIYGLKELFNKSFSDFTFYNYGASTDPDLEQIKISEPDLIISTPSHAKKYDSLKAIAPTVQIDNWLDDSYLLLAKAIGEERTFQILHKEYNDRTNKIKAQYNKDIKDKTAVHIGYRVGGKLDGVSIYHGFTAGKVLQDLGFKSIPYVLENKASEKERIILNTEVYDVLFEADYIILTLYHAFGQTAENFYELINSTLPKLATHLQNNENDSFLIAEGEKARQGLFKSYHHILDEFEKYAR